MQQNLLICLQVNYHWIDVISDIAKKRYPKFNFEIRTNSSGVGLYVNNVSDSELNFISEFVYGIFQGFAAAKAPGLHSVSPQHFFF